MHANGSFVAQTPSRSAWLLASTAGPRGVERFRIQRWVGTAAEGWGGCAKRWECTTRGTAITLRAVVPSHAGAMYLAGHTSCFYVETSRAFLSGCIHSPSGVQPSSPRMALCDVCMVAEPPSTSCREPSEIINQECRAFLHKTWCACIHSSFFFYPKFDGNHHLSPVCVSPSLPPSLPLYSAPFVSREQVKLETVQSAEFVCSKAVRDGVIDAVIDHENGWIQSQDVVDVYATDEPQQVCVRVFACVFAFLRFCVRARLCFLRRPLCPTGLSKTSVSAGEKAGAGADAGAFCGMYSSRLATEILCLWP